MKTIRLTLAAVLGLAVQHSCLASTEKEDGVEDGKTNLQRLYTPMPLENYPSLLQTQKISDRDRHQIFLDSAWGIAYKKQFEPYYASTEGIKDNPKLVELVNKIPMFPNKKDYPKDIQELEGSDEERHIAHLSEYGMLYRVRVRPRTLEEIYENIQDIQHLRLQRRQETETPNLPTQN